MKNIIPFLIVLSYFNCQKCLSQEPSGILSICGTDDRIRTDDPRIGRLRRVHEDRVGGTVWLVSNGLILTAGHVLVDNDREYYVELNIPSSEESGDPVPSAIEDRYLVDKSSIIGIDGGLGNDWAVFLCYPNEITGLLPHQKQNAFYRMTNETPTINDITRITGCGSDIGINNQTVQTDTGLYLGETIQSSDDIYHRYEVDNENNNSGSPIIWESTGFTIGIHTHAGCIEFPPYYGNHGTSFENNGLENAIQSYYGPNTIYVDLISVSPNEDGTIFSPYNTISEGINATPNGGILFITTGTYNNTGSFEINKEITILPPACGEIVINP